MFYDKRKQKRASSPIQARFSQSYCSYQLYNILGSVFSYIKRVLVLENSGCPVDMGW